MRKSGGKPPHSKPVGSKTQRLCGHGVQRAGPLRVLGEPAEVGREACGDAED
jgi:hypothetical protein